VQNISTFLPLADSVVGQRSAKTLIQTEGVLYKFLFSGVVFAM
jgi:hypothetical protein